MKAARERKTALHARTSHMQIQPIPPGMTAACFSKVSVRVCQPKICTLTHAELARAHWGGMTMQALSRWIK